MGSAIKITTMAETWDSKDSVQVAQYGTDKVCLQDSAPTYPVADDNPNEFTVKLLGECAYIRIFYGAGLTRLCLLRCSMSQWSWHKLILIKAPT